MKKKRMVILTSWVLNPDVAAKADEALATAPDRMERQLRGSAPPVAANH
jgi:hypothetical protein